MQENGEFYLTLLNTFKCLAKNERLNVVEGESVVIKAESDINLLQLTPNQIAFPISSLSNKLFSYKSTLADSFVSMEKLTCLIDALTKDDAVIRLNHCGICYKVESHQIEREQLKEEVSKTKLHLYEEPSNDFGLWLFLGNTERWDSPMFELLPIVDTTDKWIDYWLPHFQIDIDTTLSAEQIETLLKNSFGKEVIPFRSVVLDGITYVVRARLGIVSGINIDLDIATSARRVEYSRKNLLKKLL